MKKILILIILIAILAAAYWLLSANKNTKEVSQPVSDTTSLPVPTPATQSESKMATIQNFSFNPAVLEIKTGTTVVWQHNDSAPHTVTANNGLFESGRLNKGNKYSFKFTKPGEYSYHCGIRPSMTGKIIAK